MCWHYLDPPTPHPTPHQGAEDVDIAEILLGVHNSPALAPAQLPKRPRFDSEFSLDTLSDLCARENALAGTSTGSNSSGTGDEEVVDAGTDDDDDDDDGEEEEGDGEGDDGGVANGGGSSGMVMMGAGAAAPAGRGRGGGGGRGGAAGGAGGGVRRGMSPAGAAAAAIAARDAALSQAAVAFLQKRRSEWAERVPAEGGPAAPVVAGAVGVAAVLPPDQARIYNTEGRIGIYMPVERQYIVERYMAKRGRRVWAKKIRYNCRKNLADRRIRVKGRFVKAEVAASIVFKEVNVAGAYVPATKHEQKVERLLQLKAEGRGDTPLPPGVDANGTTVGNGGGGAGGGGGGGGSSGTVSPAGAPTGGRGTPTSARASPAPRPAPVSRVGGAGAAASGGASSATGGGSSSGRAVSPGAAQSPTSGGPGSRGGATGARRPRSASTSAVEENIYAYPSPSYSSPSRRHSVASAAMSSPLAPGGSRPRSGSVTSPMLPPLMPGGGAGGGGDTGNGGGVVAGNKRPRSASFYA